MEPAAPEAPPATNFTYDAFISYAHHRADAFWAKWLATGIETYRTPRPLRARGILPRVRRVFRDDDELSASTDLGARIDEALRSSRFLIVICSPRTPTSRWVREEIERFLRVGRAANVLTLLIEGEPALAFPAPLLPAPTGSQGPNIEPLAADVRPRMGESSRHLRKSALLKLLAPLLGVTYDELQQRERQRSRHRWAVLITSSVVAAVLIAFIGIFAWNQRQQALVRRADSLLAQADSQRLLYRPDCDRLYSEAYEAYRDAKADTTPVEVAFNQRLLSSPPPLVLLSGHSGPVIRLFFAGDTDALYSVGADATLRRWNLPTQSQTQLFHLEAAPVANAFFFPSGDRVLFATAAGLVAIADVRNGRTLREVARESHKLTAVAVSPDGMSVAWAGEKGLLKSLDLSTGRMLTFPAPPDSATGLVFHPDGRLLFSAADQHALQIWNATDATLLRSISYGTPAYANPVVSPDGRTILVARDGLNLGGFLWNLTDDSFLPAVHLDTHGVANPGNEDVRVVKAGVVAFAPEAHIQPDPSMMQGQAALAGEGGHVLLWDLEKYKDPQSVLIAHNARVTTLAFSPEGRYLASAGDDGQILVWNRSAFSRIAHAIYTGQAFTRTAALSADGALLASGDDDGNLKLWDVHSRTLRLSYKVNSAIVKVAFSPGDHEIIFHAIKDSAFHSWRFEDGRLIDLPKHEAPVTDFDFIPALQCFVSAAKDRTLRLWNYSSSSDHAAFRLASIPLKIAAFHTRPALAIASDTGDLLIYDLAKGRALWSIHHGTTVNSLAVLADDNVIALGDDRGLIRVWDAATGRERFSLAGHTDGVTALAGYKRRWLLSSGWDKTLRLWDLDAGKLVRSIPRGDMSGLSLSLSSSGVVASAENSFVHLWSLAIDNTWLRYRESLREATASLRRSPNELHALSLIEAWYTRCGDSVLAARLQKRILAHGGAPVPPPALAAYDSPVDPAALLWPRLYDYARRSRAPDGANPSIPIPSQLEAWANAHPDDDFSKQFRLAVNLFALHADPLQALAPIGGIVLPQELAYTSTPARLFRGGPVQENNHLFQLTTFIPNSAGTFQMRLSSADFSPYLVAREMGVSASPQQASAAKGAGAVLRMTLRKSSTVLIMCTSLETDRPGTFTLEIQRL